MTRVTLVGQAPSKTSDPLEPLSGPSGRRLASLAGLSYEDYLTTFRRVNLLQRWPGTKGGGDWVHAARAREAAAALLAASTGTDTLVLLGRRVAGAFSAAPAPLFSSFVVLVNGRVPVLFAAMPHPSGRSRFWNDPENVARASDFMRRLAAAARS